MALFQSLTLSLTLYYLPSLNSPLPHFSCLAIFILFFCMSLYSQYNCFLRGKGGGGGGKIPIINKWQGKYLSSENVYNIVEDLE